MGLISKLVIVKLDRNKKHWVFELGVLVLRRVCGVGARNTP